MTKYNCQNIPTAAIAKINERFDNKNAFPNLFLQVSTSQTYLFQLAISVETSSNRLQKYSVSKIGLTFLCLNKWFQLFKKNLTFLASSMEFCKSFSKSQEFFFHSRSEQFSKQNTIDSSNDKYAHVNCKCFRFCHGYPWILFCEITSSLQRFSTNS